MPPLPGRRGDCERWQSGRAGRRGEKGCHTSRLGLSTWACSSWGISPDSPWWLPAESGPGPFQVHRGHLGPDSMGLRWEDQRERGREGRREEGGQSREGGEGGGALPAGPGNPGPPDT